MPNHVYLVGMMGSGKTTVGAGLADYMGWDFIDLDAVIEREAGMPITQIFAERGEGYFRALEHTCLKETGKADGQVVSTGGGIVLKPANVELMKQTGMVVYLACDAETLANRLEKESHHRPLVASHAGDHGLLVKRVQELLEIRHPLYVTSAELILAPAKVDELIEQIAYAVSQS